MGWTTKNLTTSTPGTPLGTYQPTAWLFAQFTRHVVFQGFTYDAGGDGQLYELYCSASDDWHVKNLRSEADGADVATTANGYIWATQGSQHVVYQGLRFDGHVHELYYTSDDGWNSNDLTNAGHAPLTLSQPFGFETHFDGAQRVAYQGRDRHVHLLSNSGNGWHDQDLSALTGAPLCAADAAPTGYSFENQRTGHVLTRTDDGHILEYWSDASGWHWGDLTAAAGAPAASDGDVHGYVFSGQGTQHVDYVGTDGHIHELWWSTAGWHHNDLTASTGGAPCRPRLVAGVLRVRGRAVPAVTHPARLLPGGGGRLLHPRAVVGCVRLALQRDHLRRPRLHRRDQRRRRVRRGGRRNPEPVLPQRRPPDHRAALAGVSLRTCRPSRCLLAVGSRATWR